MQRVLLIKTSSLGDVVHNLPAVTDILRAFPQARIDWVVERAFAPIPALHPGVNNVIPCELRRWRRSWLTRSTRAEWQSFRTQLRAQRYDAIIDTQGLLKSALVARVAIGRRVGLDWKSSREPLRAFYHETHEVPWSMHAVERNRRLCALALGYDVRGAPEYGIRAEPSGADWLPERPYLVLLHATSHPRKLWPEERWVAVGTALARSGFGLVLPWGSEEERARAERVARPLPGAVVAPKLDLADLAGVIAGARAVVGLDTGLTHLAAALGVPVVGIYGATDPGATGIYGVVSAVNLGGLDGFPSEDEVLEALQKLNLMRAHERAGLGA